MLFADIQIQQSQTPSPFLTWKIVPWGCCIGVNFCVWILSMLDLQRIIQTEERPKGFYLFYAQEPF